MESTKSPNDILNLRAVNDSLYYFVRYLWHIRFGVNILSAKSYILAREYIKKIALL